MVSEIQLKHPFPSRRAATALRTQLVDHLTQQQPTVGDAFLTDAELVRLSGLSRSTVRRALDDLHREGWIERRIGQGTFVGPRAGMPPVGQQRSGNGESASSRQTPPLIRMAVLIFGIGDLSNDWYTPLVLEGIDEAAERCGVSVELLGNRERDVEAISRRLTQNPPDVLVCLSSEPRQAFVIRDAQRLGVRCIVTGTPHMHLGLPAVLEDNRQGMQLAVDHLVQLGHRRIVLAIQRVCEPWVLERHEGFLAAMQRHGLEADDSLVHWIPQDDPRQGNPRSEEAMAKFLTRAKPTAVISGSYLSMLYIDRLCREGRFRVPEQFSLVTTEQDLPKSHWLGGMRLSQVRFPLREMGRKVAELARFVVDQEVAPGQIVLPAEFVAGDSTRQPASQETRG